METKFNSTDTVKVFRTVEDTFTWERANRETGQPVAVGPIYFSREVCLIAAKRFNSNLPPENFIDQTRNE